MYRRGSSEHRAQKEFAVALRSLLAVSRGEKVMLVAPNEAEAKRALEQMVDLIDKGYLDHLTNEK